MEMKVFHHHYVRYHLPLAPKSTGSQEWKGGNRNMLIQETQKYSREMWQGESVV